jgi:hypothetical protein
MPGLSELLERTGAGGKAHKGKKKKKERAKTSGAAFLPEASKRNIQNTEVPSGT